EHGAQPASRGSAGGWMQKHAEKGQQQVGEVRHQMRGGIKFYRKRKAAGPDRGQQFLARLEWPLGPAMLLRLETIHIHRQLRRSNNIGEINKLPARELSAITQIEIFAQRVVLPAAALLNAGTPPQACGPVKIEKSAASAARRLLKKQMPIQKNRLHAREE